MKSVVSRIVLFTICLCLLISFVLTLVGFGFTNLFRIPLCPVNVREKPKPAAPSFYVLEPGSHVFYLGDQVESDGFKWIRVSFLHHPLDKPHDEWTEGWIPQKGTKGLPIAEREKNPLRKMLVVRNQCKWRAVCWIHKRVNRSPFFLSFGHVAFLDSDKILHTISMTLLGVVVFFFFLFALRFSLVAALLASVIVTNLVGLFNELIDFYTDKGSFETADLAANAIGCAGVIPLFLICVIFKLLYVLTRKILRLQKKVGQEPV